MDAGAAEYWSAWFTGDTFVDVGANIGRYTLRLASRFKRVIAMEPWPATFADLERNVRDAQLTNVELVNAGASTRAHWNMMYGYACGENNSVVRTHPCSGERATQTQMVRFARVDDVVGLGDGRRVDFLKIDTEGHDVEALRGACDVIDFDRPRVQVEWHRASDADVITTFFTERGYCVEKLTTSNQNVGWVLALPR